MGQDEVVRVAGDSCHFMHNLVTVVRTLKFILGAAGGVRQVRTALQLLGCWAQKCCSGGHRGPAGLSN